MSLNNPKACLHMLPPTKQLVVSAMLDALASMEGIVAIALGGSYARGTASADSDIDLGIYYTEQSPPSIEKLRMLAKQFDATPSLVVTDLYEWGSWVNGGAWLNTSAGEIDWLYRNLDQVYQVIDEALLRKFTWDFRQQPPYGYFSVTYLADLQQNCILYDPQEVLTKAKERISIYPSSLKQALIQEHLWSIEFTYFNAKKFHKRGCIYGTVGCITRIAAELTQVLFALNETYFATDKSALETIDLLPLKPGNYASQMKAVLSAPEQDASLRKMHALIAETMQLCSDFYTPKYAMD